MTAGIAGVGETLESVPFDLEAAWSGSFIEGVASVAVDFGAGWRLEVVAMEPLVWKAFFSVRASKLAGYLRRGSLIKFASPLWDWGSLAIDSLAPEISTSRTGG